MMFRFIALSVIALVLSPITAGAQLSSENYQVDGYAIGSAGQSNTGSSTNYDQEQESGGLYIYDEPAVSTPVSGGGGSGGGRKLEESVDPLPEADERPNANQVLGKLDPITICHSGDGRRYVALSNVQVFITLAEIGATPQLRGHDGHGFDIVPSFYYDIGDGVEFYPGKNWDKEGERLYANRCEAFLREGLIDEVVLPPTQVPPPVPPTETPVPVGCSDRTVEEQTITTALDDQTLVNVTVPPGSVTSKSKREKGERAYNIFFKIERIGFQQALTLTQKFVQKLRGFIETRQSGQKLPPGIVKKAGTIDYVPATPTPKQNNGEGAQELEDREEVPVGDINCDPDMPPEDTDGDGVPDETDGDDDNDGLPDNSDPNPTVPDPDGDGDGIPDDTDPNPVVPDEDSDGDGLPDTVDPDDDNDGTPDDPNDAIIVAHSIVCENETDLPDWGHQGGPNINQGFAETWVAEHPACSFAPGWSFQWSDQRTRNPGDNFAGIAPTPPWMTFGPTGKDGMAYTVVTDEQIENNRHFWVREIPRSGYIPFNYRYGEESFSAEFYCHTDVLNYDNFDRIDDIDTNDSFYCIAWNVLATAGDPVPPGTEPLPDEDSDGVPDPIDENPGSPDKDSDGDGIPDERDPNPTEPDEDTDGDGLPDVIDTDDDNDGIPDSVDPNPKIPDEDTDGDGIPDDTDPNPTTPDPDTDGDGIPDVIDPDPSTADSDGDGVPDIYDDTPGVESPDEDSDGIPDSIDGDPLTSDPDTDGDGYADEVDGDIDGDGVPNELDDTPTEPDADTDGDGVPDGIDKDIDGDGTPNQTDPDPYDPEVAGPVPDPTDSDEDGVPDSIDDDADDDGINDQLEDPATEDPFKPGDVYNGDDMIVVEDGAVAPDFGNLDPDALDDLIPLFTIDVIDDEGNQITQFDGPVRVEIFNPVFNDIAGDLYLFQPDATGDRWFLVPFDHHAEYIEFNLRRPGQVMVWHLPAAASAANASDPSGTSFFTAMAEVLGPFGLLPAGLLALFNFFSAPFSTSNIGRLLARLLNAFFGLVPFWRRRQPWGTIYDSVSKAPVDPAYVELYDLGGKKHAEAITDLDGRYGFLVDEGTYEIQVHRKNYRFPSARRPLTRRDVLYDNLYFGGPIEVRAAVNHDIPLDPIDFDWNQYEKLRTKQTHFYNWFDPFLAVMLELIFIFGAFAVALQFYKFQDVTSGILLATYLILLILRFFRGAPPLYGVLERNGQPLSFAVVRIYLGENEVTSKVADIHGRYIALVSPNTYTVRIEERISEDEYQTVYENKVPAKNGIINQRIRL